VIRFNTVSGEWTRQGSATVPDEPEHQPWNGGVLKRHVHVSRDGCFAAVVNDHGQFGGVFDLESETMTLALDGGDYYSATVPFSFAFAEIQGRTIAIHRTAWNRLDVSDPRTGELLTARVSPEYKKLGDRPAHYLDFFHGGLHVSPSGNRILDDGWMWHPVGVVRVWSLESWLSGNAWESEDGPTVRDGCARDFWNRGMVWIDENRVAVGGFEESDNDKPNRVRIIDVVPAESVGATPSKTMEKEIVADFVGPQAPYFCDGLNLYSTDSKGLSRWNPTTGECTGCVEQYRPTRFNSNTGEFAEVSDGSLLRLLTIS